MKVVIVLDEELPLGLLANAAAALAFSVSPSLPDCVGAAVSDRSGDRHPGITNIPLPILAAPATRLAELREVAAYAKNVSCTDFSDTAQRSKNYADYAIAIGKAAPESIRYLGLCIYGEDATVRSLTGNLPLLGSREVGVQKSATDHHLA
jgi:hypothetical protein